MRILVQGFSPFLASSSARLKCKLYARYRQKKAWRIPAHFLRTQQVQTKLLKRLKLCACCMKSYPTIANSCSTDARGMLGVAVNVHHRRIEGLEKTALQALPVPVPDELGRCWISPFRLFVCLFSTENALRQLLLRQRLDKLLKKNYPT